MSLPIEPGIGLDFIALGSSLQVILTALKADHKRFPKVDVSFSPSQPVCTPVVVDLPKNGIRLRFDGQQQDLRLIELLDLDLHDFTYKGDHLTPRPFDGAPSGPRHLLYRRVYQLFGPSYPGKFLPFASDAKGDGMYILSFDGIAFNFPLPNDAWSSDTDHAQLLSSSAAPVTSIAIFKGPSWPEASKTLFEQSIQRSRDGAEDSIVHIQVADDGTLHLLRSGAAHSLIVMGETTAQDLVTDLGPPDTIYKRPGHILEPPSARVDATNSSRRRSSNYGPHRASSHGSGPSSFSSTNTDSYDIDFEDDSAVDGPDVVRVQEQYYCYFRHGFDVLLSLGTSNHAAAIPTATRVVIHGNVPGSYPFNRHHRVQWSLQSCHVTSESNFASVHNQLVAKYRAIWPNEDMQSGMVIVRNWGGDSPGGSAILVENDSEDDDESASVDGQNSEQWLKNTRLYKFPGLMFEVMHNDAISALTVYSHPRLSEPS